MIRTQTATVVFTDFVGSTEASIRLGHDAYDAMRRSHFDALRLAASIHRGSEIKSTGDGLIFAFASAGDAVACMIRMQQAIDLAARRSDASMRMRIGASSGEISRERNDVFGIAVVEAARLCSAASPGQILVSDLVRGLTRGLRHAFAPAGQLALKGLPEPVSAFAVEWAPRDASSDAIPLPSRMAPTPAIGLYGRASERAIIERCWTAAKQGDRQVVFLAGEPGIGKTRLGFEAGRSAHREGAIVLLGTCDEEIGHPYRPFVEALRHYVAHAPDDVLLHHVQEHRGDLLRIVPSLAERVPNIPSPRTADAETERYLMFEAVTGLLATASQHCPIMLILDDLQWAGASELLILKHIVRSTAPLRLLIVGTYRDTELSQAPRLTSLLADFRRESGVERIAMRGLAEDEVVEFVAAAVGHELNSSQIALARAIGRDTEGSPLFVGEILRNLIADGTAFGEGAQASIVPDVQTFGVPEGVQDAIAQRLSRLSSTTNRVLSVASVIGPEFEMRVLEQAAEMSEAAILDALDEAMSAGMVAEARNEPDWYAFTHILMRASLYESLNPTRRARMHERVGTALEHLASDEPGQRIDELARHWIAAAPVGNTAKAIGFARQAGDRSLAGLAFEQAAKYYEQAVALIAPDGREAELLRCDLLIALGDAQRRAGDSRYRETVGRAVGIARSVGDARRFASAALGIGRPEHPFANANLIDEGLIGLYHEAINGLHDGDDKILLAKLYSQLAGEMLYTPQRERRKELSHRAVVLARQCADQSLLAQALHIHASAINDPTTLAERLVLTAEQIKLADEALSLEMRWAGGYQRMGALLESGDIAGAEQMLLRLKELASKLRQPFFSWATAHALAMMHVMFGEPGAEQKVLEAHQLGTAGGQPEAQQSYVSQLSVIRRDQGRHAELIGPLRAFSEKLPHLPVWRVVLAGLYCETDQLDEARAEIRALGDGALEIQLDWTWASTMMSLAQVCSDLDHQELAGRYYTQLQPVAGQVGVTGIGLVCYGSLALPCGQMAACLRRWREAEQYFVQAMDMNLRIGARPYLVRTRRAYASMLLARGAIGDSARAAKVIDEGRVEAHQLGMRREIDRLERLHCTMSSPAAAVL
jgi:class 3 adenylate cyclase/tetratricopeptide (TPR) repeat protein